MRQSWEGGLLFGFSCTQGGKREKHPRQTQHDAWWSWPGAMVFLTSVQGRVSGASGWRHRHVPLQAYWLVVGQGLLMTRAGAVYGMFHLVQKCLLILIRPLVSWTTRLMREVHIMQRLRHPNIIRLVEALDTPEQVRKSDEIAAPPIS